MRRIECEYYHRTGNGSRESPFKNETRTAQGYFHQWSIEGGDGETDSVAIVELDDGTVITPRAAKCKFLTSPIT